MLFRTTFTVPSFCVRYAHNVTTAGSFRGELKGAAVNRSIKFVNDTWMRLNINDQSRIAPRWCNGPTVAGGVERARVWVPMRWIFLHRIWFDVHCRKREIVSRQSKRRFNESWRGGGVLTQSTIPKRKVDRGDIGWSFETADSSRGGGDVRSVTRGKQ